MSAHRFIRCLAAAGLVFGLAAAPVRAAGPASALEVRTGLHKDFTRLVVETSQPVPYKFSFPKDDEIVVTVTGAALHAAAQEPKARGIIRDIEIEPSARGSRLIVRTKARADIRRQFTLLPKDGHGARIVIDLAAQAVPGPAPLQAAPPKNAASPASPRVLLPAPHTDIVGEAAPAPARNPAERPASTQARARPAEPFEVAGNVAMLFDATPASETAPLELAQAGGLSINDWLLREGANPNVRTVPPAPAANLPTSNAGAQPPAPPAYPATPVYRAPAGAVPARGTAFPAYGQSPYGQPSYGQPVYSNRPAYPAYAGPQPTSRPTPQHPAHPGYRTPSAQSRDPSSWTPPPAHRQARASEPAANDPASRYARQKQDTPVEQQATPQPRRFYAGLGLGLSWLSYESERNNTTLDEDLIAWKLFGGYRMSRLIGFELAYGNVGGVKETLPGGNSTENEFYAVSASTLVSVPLNPLLTPFARVGLDLWWESADGSAGSASKEDSGAGIVLGLGADYSLGDNLAVRGEWEFHLLTDEVYANNFLASVLYKF